MKFCTHTTEKSNLHSGKFRKFNPLPKHAAIKTLECMQLAALAIEESM
jgi:hypothetical protein